MGGFLKLTVISLRHDPEMGFDAAELVSFCEAHEVQAWTEHFFVNGGKPELAVILQYEERAKPKRGGRAPNRERDFRRELPAADRPIYDRLRQWRSLRARQDGVPVYVVFGNAELAAIAQARPKTKEALRAIEGVGKAKADKYADDVFTVLASLNAEAGETGEAPGDDA
jgi:superfamily II DNA helicase RecQ